MSNDFDFRKYRVPVFNLLIISLVVGLVLAFFDLRPEELLANFGEAVKSIFNFVVSIVEWVVPYILMGAVVVVPIWVIIVLWRFAVDHGGPIIHDKMKNRASKTASTDSPKKDQAP